MNGKTKYVMVKWSSNVLGLEKYEGEREFVASHVESIDHVLVFEVENGHPTDRSHLVPAADVRWLNEAPGTVVPLGSEGWPARIPVTVDRRSDP